MNPLSGEPKRFTRILLVSGGILALILGIIGVVVPLLPTTPFLLISAACFVKSSDHLYQWLINHKWFGKIIRNYREHHAISLAAKVSAVALLWLTILVGILYCSRNIYIRLVLAAVAIGVSTHILHFKTLKEDGD